MRRRKNQQRARQRRKQLRKLQLRRKKLWSRREKRCTRSRSWRGRRRGPSTGKSTNLKQLPSRQMRTRMSQRRRRRMTTCSGEARAQTTLLLRLQRLKLWQKSRQRKHWQWLRANAVFLNCMISFLPSTFCYIISYIISLGFELCNCHSQYAVRVEDVSCH